jgi:hypothetical protein
MNTTETTSFFIKLFQSSDFKRFIGLDFNEFDKLLSILQKIGLSDNANYALNQRQRLALVLLKLRQNPSNKFLEFIIGVPESNIQRYTSEIINLLYEVLIHIFILFTKTISLHILLNSYRKNT